MCVLFSCVALLAMGGVSKSRVRCARVGIAVCSHLVFLTMVVLGLVILFWYRYGTPPATVPLSPAPGVFADLRADNLSDAASYIWVQASDIHVRGPTAPSTQAFREFCSDVLPHLDPAFVLIPLPHASLCSRSHSHTHITGTSL